jgi:hypothetical protein
MAIVRIAFVRHPPRAINAILERAAASWTWLNLIHPLCGCAVTQATNCAAIG